jgi:aminobenzoyl-glutamate transport protein
MSSKAAKAKGNEKKSFTEKMLDGVERVGNKVPHPVIMFLYLIAIVMVLSHVMYMMGVSVTDEIAVPVETTVQANYYEDSSLAAIETPEDPYTDDNFEIREETIAIQSLLTADGIRFIFTSFVSNFANFSVVAVIFVAMLGVGVAEEAGLMAALIRKLVIVAPRRMITFIIIFVGVLSSVASDAGYLILIPLGAAAFLSVGRHPLAGIAAAFAGVSAAFGVNLIIAPIDGLITEITNEALQIVAPGTSLTLTANIYFSIASSFFLALIATIVTERIIEPRLGKYDPKDAPADAGQQTADAPTIAPADEARGLQYSLYGFLGITAVVALFTLWPGGPLQRPDGAVGGNSPLMDSLIFIITLMFLMAGIGFGLGAKTIKSSADVIKAITKTFAGLSGLICQFIAHFNYSNMPRVIAISMAGILEQANIGAVPLLVGLILVIMLLNFIIPGIMPKWAIFAPVFIPLFVQLGVAPQTVLAAYRIGDSPTNVITPLMVYFPFIALVAQRYQKDAGVGSIIALMLPYTIIMAIAWTIFFVIWFVLGIPLGPGYPVVMP